MAHALAAPSLALPDAPGAGLRDRVAPIGPGAAAIDDDDQLALFTQWEVQVDALAAGNAAERAVQPASSAADALDADDSACRIGVSHLQLTGLHCAACAGDIERALMAQPGVLGAEVNGASQRAKVRWDARRTRISAVIGAVEASGYGAAPDVARSARELRAKERRDMLWRLFVAGFLSMQVMMLATPSYVSARGDIAADLQQLLAWGQWVLAVPVLVFGAGPFFSGAWRSFKQRRIGMDVPVSMGLLATFVVSSIVAFDPTGPLGHELYFDSMTMFVAFLWVGRWMEMRARHQAAESLEASVRQLPETAWRVLDSGDVQEVPVSKLRRGDRVRVPAGASVPADGVLVSEGAALEEALLTGESLAVSKARGQALLAGSINVLSPFEMDVQRVGTDTRQAMIASLMREALACRPDVVRLADRWAGPFLWAVLALAAAGGAAWSVIDPSRAAWVVVSVLIVTCPCALSLATPATWVAAASGLARRGILLRRLEALQPAAALQHLFVDKTGTLTQTAPRLDAWQAWAPDAPPAVQADGQMITSDCPMDTPLAQSVQAALQLARWSAHPLSKALREQLPEMWQRAAAQEMQPDLGEPTIQLSGIVELAGRGMQGTDADGRLWRLGSAAWAEAGLADGGAQVPGQEGARLSLSCDGRARMAFVFTETLRTDARDAVAGLRARGLQISLLSGDTAHRAERVAQALGIAHVHASASPEDKLRLLRETQAGGQVCGMLGDGLNDSAVLGAADVSMAMGDGAALAQQHADVVLLDGRPGAVVDLLDAARKTLRVVRQNLAWSVTYNAACIPAALVGWLPPWAAGLGMAVSSLAVILNAQRAGR